VLRDPALHARIADAARRHVGREFCVDFVVPQYERYYEQVVRGA
jgi:hypothetical protein